MLHLFTLAAAQTGSSCSPELCSGAGGSKCPLSQGLYSKPLADAQGENVYFRNAALHAVDLLRVGTDGIENSHGLLAPGARRAMASVHGEVWVARAVRPGTHHDRRLLLEHRVGTVPIRDCDCPQPAFVDCSKTPSMRDGSMISDPVVFENLAPVPVDVFYYNGTCEELVSWDEIGGVQSQRSKPLLSTQGHSFRLRAATPTRRLLMAHTLNDLVVRGCDDDEGAETTPSSRLGASSITLDGLEALRAETRFFEREHDQLKRALATELAQLSLKLKLRDAGVNVTSAPENAASGAVQRVGVGAGAGVSLLGVAMAK